jgi:V8-like Glu-specific endopeptidase
MVRLSTFTATALLSFSAITFGLPELRRQTQEIKQAIGIPTVPAEVYPVLFTGPAIQYKELSLEDLKTDGTAPPSAGIVAHLAEMAKRDESRRSIIGPDNRQIPPNSSFPFQTMGKIQWSNGVWCSGSLVGPRHVATARHCSAPPSGVSIRFTPYSFGGGEPFGGAYVTTVVTGPAGASNPNGGCTIEEDWAIFILDSRLGDQQQYLGASVVLSQWQDQPIFNAFGYPGDLNNGIYPYWQSGITVKSVSPFACDQWGPSDTDADAMGGQSGGPLWLQGSGSVFGVVSSGVDVSSGGVVVSHTLFAGGSNFFGGVVNTRNNFP